MGDITSSPASRIAPLSADDKKDFDDADPGKPLKFRHAPRKAPLPPVDVGKDDEHQLDEQA
jgi:hypothetical protein